MSAYELSLQVRKLVKDKDYKGALAAFKAGRASLSPQEIAVNGYLISSVITSLRKTGQDGYTEALLKQFSIDIHPDCNPQVLGAYGWVVYDRLKRLGMQVADEPAFEDDVDDPLVDDGGDGTVPESPGMREILRQSDHWLNIMIGRMTDFDYMVVTKVLQARVKAERARKQPDWNAVKALLIRFSPEQFSDQSNTVRMVVKGREKDVEFASDRERWYMDMIHVHAQMGMHEECKRLALEALGAFEQLHHGNEVWFARRLALAAGESGDRNAAIKGLKDVLRRKDAWFIRWELAEMLKEDGQVDEALLHCRMGMAGHGDLPYKVGLVLLTARLLRSKGELGLSYRHYRLWELIREQEGWPIADAMLPELSDIPADVSAITRIGHLMHDLKEFWTSASPRPKNVPSPPPGRALITGRIYRIKHNNDRGISGFVSRDNGSNIYFTAVPAVEERVRWVEGVAVSFHVIDQEDGRKKAIHVRLV